MRKKHTLLIAKMMLLFVTLGLLPMNSVSAGVTMADTYDDICKMSMDGIDEFEECNLSISYLDIVKVGYDITSNGTINLFMLLGDAVVEDENVHYVVWYNHSGSNNLSRYMMDYSNGKNTGMAKNVPTNTTTSEIFAPQVTNSLIVVSYKLFNSSFSNENLAGMAYRIDGDERWVDKVPNKKSVKDPEEFEGIPDIDVDYGDTDTTNGTPGFSLIILIAAAVLIIGVLKQKRRN